nr:PspC domain-containing protein [uncultured Sphingomonas sp.]
MTAKTTPLPLRNDTILGVCEAIGTDFGFHPNWLRVALAGVLFFSPLAAFSLYFGLGIVVAASRWFAPDKTVDAGSAIVESTAKIVSDEQLPLAA